MGKAKKANKSVPAKGESRQFARRTGSAFRSPEHFVVAKRRSAKAWRQWINCPGTRLKRWTANPAAGKAAKVGNGGDGIIRMMQCMIDSAQRYGI